MLPTTFKGESVYLLPYFANWADALSLSLEIKSDIVRSLGGREARKSYAPALRATFNYSLFLEDRDSAAFRSALRNLADKRVLVPLWPLAHMLSDAQLVYTDAAGNLLAAATGAFHENNLAAPPFSTGIWLTLDPADVTNYCIHETAFPPSSFTIPPHALRVPLMLGVLDALPDPQLVTPGLLTVPIKFRDTAPPQYALTAADPAPQTAADGRAIFPFDPDWGNTVKAGGTQYEITREDIGYSREPSTTYYPQNAARPYEATFQTFAWSELARLVSFFQTQQGVVKSFWVNHPTDGQLLSRFTRPALDLTFTKAEISQVKIAFLEIPDEVAAPAGETLDKTLGGLPATAWLYRLTRKYPGQTVIDRYTSYERDITVAGEIFQAKGHFDHDDITDSLKPEESKVKLTCRIFDGNPLALFSPPRLEVPIIAEILECRPDATGNAPTADILFVGRIQKPQSKGPIITADISHILEDLERNAPTMLIQPDCNYEFCSPPCGLSIADWTFTATVARADGVTLTLANFKRANNAALPAISAAWFAYGRIWCGSGATFETRTIFNSTAPVDGSLTLTLSQPFTAPAGTLSLAPGCDGSCDTCRNKYNNYARYGGHPYVPVGNPSLVAVKKDTTAGKK